MTCPHCGARLRVGDGSVVRCEYCGTDARVQRRTVILDRVKPPPEQGPRPIAVQQINPAARKLVWLSFLLPVAIGGFVTWQVQRNVSRATQQAFAVTSTTTTQTTTSFSSSSPGDPEWQGTRPAIIVDVDGNGAPDLVGRSRRVSAGDQVRLMALDGATGKVTWESEPLGTYSDTYNGPLAIAGDVVVYASPGAEVRGVALATGKTMWTTRLDERVKALCEGSTPDTFIALGADDVLRPLRRADGTGVTAELPPAPPAKGRRKAPPCTLLPSDVEASSRDRRDDKLGDKHELSSAQVVTGPGGRVLAGQRARGTRVATLVGLDDKGEARWKVPVPQDPLGSTEREVEAVVVGENEVCAAYYAKSIVDPLHVACFALADGARRWDQQSQARSLRHLQVLGSRLVITAVGSIDLREIATGARVWRFGD